MPKTGAKAGRGWHQVAGPPLSSRSFHAAVLGADELPATRANAAFAEYWATARHRAARRCRFKRSTPPVNIIGGHRFSGAPKIDLNPPASELSTPSIRKSTAVEILADLSIPEFLLCSKGKASI